MGANDHLDVGSAGDFNYLHDNTGTWTAEFWVCPQVVNSRQTVFSTGGNSSATGFCTRIMEQGTGGSSNGYFVTAQISKGSGGNYLYWASDPTRLDANTWYHIALVYDNTDETLKIYVDGKLTNSGFSHVEGTFGSHSTSNSSHSLHIGEEPYNNALDLTGHISNLRILNGVKLYTSNFKPPMKELEVTPETTLLCCQSKTDASLEKTGKTITANGNAVANELTPGLLTPVPESGAGSAITGSVEFNGTDDYLKLPTTTDFTFGTNDWTIEFWLNPGENSSNYTIILALTSATTTDRFEVAYHGSTIRVYTDTGTWRDTGITPSKGDWHHIAFVRNYSGNSLIMYLNGVNRWEVTNTRDYDELFTTADIGSYASSSYGYLQGFISNFRIVNGNALYTEDFTPPTRELKKVPGTVLLCCQDPDNPLTEATGKTITGYGDLDQVYNTQLVPNGDFSDGTNDWSDTGSTATLSVSSGQMTITNSSGTNGRATGSAFKTTIGARYVLKYDAITSGGSYRAEIRQASGGGAEQAFQSTTDGVTETFEFQATHAQHSVVIYSIGANGVATKYDNVYVYKVLPGKTGSNFTPQVGDDRKVTFEGVTKVNSDAYFYLPTGDTASRETTGTYNAGTRGIFGGGFSTPSTHHDTIQYINIASQGHAIDAGDLTVSRYGNAALASATRAVWAGGVVPTPTTYNTIDAVEIMSTGNAFDFGDLYTTVYYPGGVSNRTRGIYAGGYNPADAPSGFQNNIGYITISSKGNTQDFGDLITARNSFSTFNSPTRGCFAGGATPSQINTIEYVTIATTGNASDFGDLSQARNYGGGCGSAIRGLVGGGSTPTVVNTIDYVTISAMGNAADFGDLTTVRAEVAGCSSATRGVFAGSWSPSKTNTIDFVTIQTTSNAVNFGDLVNIGVMQEMGTSNGHGGLG